MNNVVLIGRLTKDPELRFTPGKGTAVTTFTIAGIAQKNVLHVRYTQSLKNTAYLNQEQI